MVKFVPTTVLASAFAIKFPPSQKSEYCYTWFVSHNLIKQIYKRSLAGLVFH